MRRRRREGLRLARVVSGGQTGVDQAALRAARACGIPLGGWCPPGRACEGGRIPACFPLTETPAERSPDAQDVPRSLRTEWNVRDSDATLVLRPAGPPADPAAAPDPGTDWTLRCAARLGRPLLVCDPAAPGAAERIVDWLASHRVGSLHVAGPSEGRWPGAGASVHALLLRVLRDAAG